MAAALFEQGQVEHVAQFVALGSSTKGKVRRQRPLRGAPLCAAGS